ncbi:MAG: UDP-glucose 6-dehydrogenase TuaD [Xylophilus sp.]|nr:MAG: UDP-glucose 6-dehydrogenase TuaD [Xylophilus sp.]
MGPWANRGGLRRPGRGLIDQQPETSSPTASHTEILTAPVIVTEWKVFRTPHFGKLRAALRQPLVFDGRNLYAPQRMRDEGFEYHAIGRPA